MDCHCAHGWVCEGHPDQPEDHDGCTWPGERCSNPDCPWWQGSPPAALTGYFDVVIASTRDSDEDH